MAFEQSEAGHRIGPGGKTVAGFEVGAEADTRHVVEPGERHVRRKLAPLRLEPRAHRNRFDLVAQENDRLGARSPRPQGVRVAAAVEKSNPAQGEAERGCADEAKPRVQLLGAVAVGFANEAERQVEVVLGDPARAGHAALQGAQPRAGVLGQRQGDE